MITNCNAKDFGVPQNRERVFVVSILGEHEPYEFPEPIELKLRLKDVLEEVVDEKFYLSEEKTQQLVTTVSKNYSEKTVFKMNRNEVKGESQIANALLARDYKGFGNQDMNGVIEPTPTRLGGIFDKNGKKHQSGSVWDKRQVAPTLDTMQGGWRQPSVLIKNATKKGYLEATDGDGVVEGIRIRKLTPKECWRLMGFSDDDFHKAEEVNSNTQLYKQAGNSIVVDVLEAIFKQLLED